MFPWLSFVSFVCSWIHEFHFLQLTHEWTTERTQTNHKRIQRGVLSHQLHYETSVANWPEYFTCLRSDLVHSWLECILVYIEACKLSAPAHMCPSLLKPWFILLPTFWRIDKVRMENGAPSSSWLQERMPLCAETNETFDSVSNTPFTLYLMGDYFLNFPVISCAHSVTHSRNHCKRIELHEFMEEHSVMRNRQRTENMLQQQFCKLVECTRARVNPKDEWMMECMHDRINDWMNKRMDEGTNIGNATNSAVHSYASCWLITRYCLDLWSSPLFPESCIVGHKPVFDPPDPCFQHPRLMEGVDIASNIFFKDRRKLTTKMRQKCAEHLWGRTPFGRYRVTFCCDSRRSECGPRTEFSLSIIYF